MVNLKQIVQQKVKSALNDVSSRFNESLNETFFQSLFSSQFYQLLNQLLRNKEMWYVRHAQSPINKYFEDSDNFGKRYPNDQKLFDPKITQQGYEQVWKLPILHFDIAYISPLSRTLQTFFNMNIKLRKDPIVTPLIREKSRTLAGVVGSPSEEIQSHYPDYTYQWIQPNKYWWRHDYKDQPFEALQYETNRSFRARIAFFFLCILLEGSLNILIVSHMAFYEIFHKCEYYQKPMNAKLIKIDHNDIIRMFKKIEKSVSPKL